MIMRSISAAWMSMVFVLWSSAGMAETPYYAGKTIGTDEREIMQSWGGDYNGKLAFAEISGVYLSDVELWIEKDGREMVHATANGPWSYIKLPPGRYTVKATYEDETKQIKNVQLVEGGHVTRLVHWDAEEES